MAEGWCARSYVSDALLAARATGAYSPPGGRGLAGGHRGSRARGRSTWNWREPMFSAWTYCIGLVGTVRTTALNSCVGDTATGIPGLEAAQAQAPQNCFECETVTASRCRIDPFSWRGMVWALEASPWPVRGLAPMRTPARCRYLRSGRVRVRPAVRPWCAAPGGAGRLRIRDWTRDGIGRSSMRPAEHACAVSRAPCHRAAAGIRAIRIPRVTGVPRGTWPTPVLESRGRCVGLGA